jgi:hypothetical protein
MINKKEMDSVVILDANKRYQYFIKKVADSGLIWALYKDGWALAGDHDGQELLPFWPAKEYADLCAKGIWEGYEAEALDVHDFLDEYLDELKADNIFPTIFYTAKDKGIVPELEKLKKDLRCELSRIE